MPYLCRRVKKTLLALRKCVFIYIYGMLLIMVHAFWILLVLPVFCEFCAACNLWVFFAIQPPQLPRGNYSVCLPKKTRNDKASYASSPPCRFEQQYVTLVMSRYSARRVISLSLALSLSCSLLVAPSLSLSISHVLSLCLSWSLPLLLSLSHTYAHTLSFSLSCSLANTHIHQVYKAHNVSSTLRVYFLSYTESVEEQRYLSEVRRETGENSRKSARESICHIKWLRGWLLRISTRGI